MADAPVKFTAVNVTPTARDALRLAAVHVSAALGRRVSMSDALRVIAALAESHQGEIQECAARVLDAPNPSGEEPTP